MKSTIFEDHHEQKKKKRTAGRVRVMSISPHGSSLKQKYLSQNNEINVLRYCKSPPLILPSVAASPRKSTRTKMCPEKRPSVWLDSDGQRTGKPPVLLWPPLLSLTRAGCISRSQGESFNKQIVP